MAEPGSYESAGLRKAHVTLNNEQVKALPSTPIEVIVPSMGNSFLFVHKAFCHANIKDKYTLSDDSPVTNDSNISIAWYQDGDYIEAVSNKILGGQVPVVPTEWAWILDDNRVSDGANPNALRSKPIYVVALSENGNDFKGGHEENFLVFEMYFVEVDLTLPVEPATSEIQPPPEEVPIQNVFIGQSTPPLLQSFCAMEGSDQSTAGTLWFSKTGVDFTTDNSSKFAAIVSGSVLRMEEDATHWQEYYCVEPATIEGDLVTVAGAIHWNAGQPIEVNHQVTITITAPTALSLNEFKRRR